MRTQTFISSMVGVVAAAAVAGSVSAGFVDSFTTAFDTSPGTDLIRFIHVRNFVFVYVRSERQSVQHPVCGPYFD